MQKDITLINLMRKQIGLSRKELEIIVNVPVVNIKAGLYIQIEYSRKKHACSLSKK